MNVMVVGGNFRGKGAEAMLLTVIRELGARVPQISFLVLTGDNQPVPNGSLDLTERIPVSFFTAPPRSLADWAFAGFSWLLQVDRWSKSRQHSQCASQSVAVVDISGYSFMPRGRFPGRTASHHSTKLALTKLAGAHHILLPQVMGPVTGRLDRWLAHRALLLASSITVRDEITWSILNDMGVTKARSVDICPDIAFLFSAAPDARAREILEDIGVGDAPFLAVTPNMRVYERSPVQQGTNVYLDTLVRLVQDIVDELNVAVLVIPHESEPGAKDDVWLANQILTRLEASGQVFQTSNQYTAAEIKSVIGNAQLVVGSRYHSLIAALSMRVPCLAISWSHKYEMLMESVGLADCVFRMDGLDYDLLKRKVFNLWTAREQTVVELERVVAGFELEVSRLFDRVAGFIEQASVQQDLKRSTREHR